GYFYWKCVSGISNVKTPAKNEKNSPVPAGYTLDKNNDRIKKRLVITQLPMLKVIT
ncbi:LOW QUALITY PROTEIN: phage amidase, partial [Staphylococcus aureus A6224]